MIKKIISGGQTGADQAALDVAIKLKISHGGWLPKGRLTEKGALENKYKLKELPTTSYEKRTKKNIIDSDGTLILSNGILTGGSLLTKEYAFFLKKPHLHIDLLSTSFIDAIYYIRVWVDKYNIKILNIAGSRASKDPNIYKRTFDLLCMLFDSYC